MNLHSPTDVATFLIEKQIVDHAFAPDLPAQAAHFESAEPFINDLVRLGRLTHYQRSMLLSGEGEKLIFGPYRLIQLLGEGGMGKVFKAWHPRLDRLVALKFVHPEQQETRSHVMSRFHREARAIAQLQHPNVVLLYDADEIDGIPYIAMEFVNGMSLAELVVQNGPLGVNTACEYIRQAAMGLQHAFECGLVHRDIKPSNIVVSHRKSGSQPSLKATSLVTIRDRNRMSEGSHFGRNDRIKILDMGLALLKDSLKGDRWNHETALTGTGTTLGTPDYIAPEQARDSRNVDIRADLYSLGCTFYFILSGQRPFPNGTAVEKLLKHQLDQPTSLAILRPNLPKSITNIVEKLIAKKPAERFQTPQELVDALAAHLVLSASDSAIPIAARSTAPPVPSLPIGPSLATIRLKTLELPKGANKAAAEQVSHASHPDPVAVVAEKETLLDSLEFEAEFGDVDHNLEPIHEASYAAPDKPEQVPVAKVAAHECMVCGVAVSADGHFAATGDVNGRVRIWDLTGFEPSEIAELHRPTEIQAIVFDPNDSDVVVFGELRKGKAALTRWEWNKNSYADLGDVTALDQNGIGSLGFTGDGKMLAAGVGSLAITWKIDRGTATARKIHKGQTTPIRALAVSPDHQMLATAGQHDSLRFWDLDKRSWNGNSGVQARSPAASVTTMCYSPQGNLLAIAGADPEIILWDMSGTAERSVRALRGHTSNLLHCQFVDDGNELVSVAINGQVIFWNVRTATIARSFNLSLNMAYRIAISPDATRLVAGFSNGTVAFCKLAAAACAIPEAELLTN